MSGEAASRARPDLPGRQAELAQAVLGLGKPVVALLSSGRPLMVPWLFERAHAVLATWFLGSEAGHAIGDVLSGRWNPTGRLPVSWPVDVGQIPIFYAQRPTGRPPIRRCTIPASTSICRSSRCSRSGTACPTRASAERAAHQRRRAAAGRGDHDRVRRAQRGPGGGEETLLLFVRDPVASVARPLLELKGMAKIALAPRSGDRPVHARRRRSGVPGPRPHAAPRARHRRAVGRPQRGPGDPAQDEPAPGYVLTAPIPLVFGSLPSGRR